MSAKSQTTLLVRVGRAEARPLATFTDDDPEQAAHLAASESAAFQSLVAGGTAADRIRFERVTTKLPTKGKE